MPDKLPGFVAELIADCYKKGITDSREILETISGHYVVDESCIEKYKDILSAATAETIE
jgi:hypothetical protein